MSLPISLKDGPNSFLACTPFSKNGVAGEFDFAREHGRRSPTFHPIPLTFRTKKRESHAGTARQVETSSSADLLCSTLRENGICKGDDAAHEHDFESNHKESHLTSANRRIGQATDPPLTRLATRSEEHTSELQSLRHL